MITEPIAVTLVVIQALESLGVPYLIGGSLASALHGVPRATNGADLIVDVKREEVEVSDRQWRDVLGVLKAQGEKLDVNYLRDWAARLSLDDLLERALTQAKR